MYVPACVRACVCVRMTDCVCCSGPHRLIPNKSFKLMWFNYLKAESVSADMFWQAVLRFMDDIVVPEEQASDFKHHTAHNAIMRAFDRDGENKVPPRSAFLCSFFFLALSFELLKHERARVCVMRVCVRARA